MFPKFNPFIFIVQNYLIAVINLLVYGPDIMLVPSGGKGVVGGGGGIWLVGRINVKKMLLDNPTKRLAYSINLTFSFR